MTNTELFLTLYNFFKPNFVEKNNDFLSLLSLIIGENSKPDKVKLSLEKFQAYSTLDKFLELSQKDLELLIKPNSFYKTKAKILFLLARAIKKDFSSYENFLAQADKAWLLKIKGLGLVKADFLACFILRQEVFIIDSKVSFFAKALSFDFESYEEISDFFSTLDEEKISKLCKLTLNKNELFVLYYELICKFDEEFLKKNKVDDFLLLL